MKQFEKKMLFDPDTIATRVKQLGEEISAKYPEGDLVLIGILKGSFMFLADLVRHLSVPCQLDFARISSVRRRHRLQWQTQHSNGYSYPGTRSARNFSGRYSRYRFDSKRIP